MIELVKMRDDENVMLSTHWDFLRQISNVFRRLADYHTRMIIGSSLQSYAGFLPFIIEPVTNQSGTLSAIVTRVLSGFSPPAVPTGLPGEGLPAIGSGYEVLAIDQLPVHEWIQEIVPIQFATNPASQLARALPLTTVRPLLNFLPPADSDALVVTVSPPGREDVQIAYRCSWRYVIMGERRLKSEYEIEEGVLDAPYEYSESNAVAVTRVKKLVVTTHLDNSEEVETRQYRMRVVRVGKRSMAHLRLFEFPEDSFTDHHRIYDEAKKFLSKSEREGVDGYLIDLRANPGGGAQTAERLLSLLTPVHCKSMRMQLRNTPLSWAYCIANAKDSRHSNAKIQSFQTLADAILRRGHRYTHSDTVKVSTDLPEPMGLTMPGAVLVDAGTYSAAEVFAAGFRDNGVGPILGTSPCTGGGGATRLRSSTIAKTLVDEGLLSNEHPLAHQTFYSSFSVASMRFLRNRRRDRIFEGIGIQIDGEPIAITRNDALGHNEAMMQEVLDRILAYSRLMASDV